jgi:hypothetical protein
MFSISRMLGLVVCTTGSRVENLIRCLNSFDVAEKESNSSIIKRVFTDIRPSKELSHLVEVRNRAMDNVDERWALLCDDDDFVFSNHLKVLLSMRCNYPNATVLMTQACNLDSKPLGFTISCSMVNVDRFRMVNWLCPNSGGEDFFTLSTLQARGHLIIKEPTVTWQVCDDTPSLTRDVRVELQK